MMLMLLSGVGTILAIIPLLLAHLVTAANVPGSLNSYLAAHPIITTSGHPTKAPVDPSSNSKSLSLSISSARSRCPASCDESGLDPFNWTVYHGVNRLSWCNQTMLLDFALHNSLDDPLTHASIRCCTTSPDAASSSGADASSQATASRVAKRGNGSATSCLGQRNLTLVRESLQMAFNESDASGSVGDFVEASQQLGIYLAQQKPSCNQTTAFAYSGSAVVGLFAGSGIQSQDIAASVLQQFITSVESSGFSESVLVQLCSGNGRSSRYSMGIIANAHANIGLVQDAVATWAAGGCVTTYDRADTWHEIALSIPRGNSTHGIKQVTSGSQAARALAPRTTCSTIQVASGDTCATLASECGITPAQFTTYNPSSTECSTLAIGEHVCCSAGTLPDFSPKPYSNGTCATYLVVAGDDCSQIAATYSLTVNQLTNFNNNTWGWMGCTDLQAGNAICLSSGSPPMPAVLVNAVCGPQVPGTPIASTGTNLSTLNQCPLNACCDIWGECGITAEFCTITESPTGAPGTAAAGTDGCISNCGTAIVTGSAPAEYFKVGYFEGFNSDRPCLNQPITSVDLSTYTHVHLAFANITTGFALDVSSMQDQFDSFVSMTGFKKIISVGGWTFCTDPSTYTIFREAVTQANMDAFVANIVSFIEEYQLDGIDLDWEYPAEPDIPGIPAGSHDDSINYVSFLDLLAVKMPAGTTISVTAPASFWYLRGFMIAEMVTAVDYFVYMTYDEHGQWDYGNAFTDPGCPGGNCLRSDVNLTETMSALSMVTKAGVPANKIVVGVTSYGRSFQMTTAGCYTEMCTWTGPNSGAYAGLCTQTPGYISNAEINGILAGNGTVTSADGSIVKITGNPLTYLDSNSYSNIVVYDSTQWVGYMDDTNKAARAALYKTYNFAGTADWAIDLQSYTGDAGDGGSSSVVSVSPSIWTSGSPSIQCEPPCVIVLPPYPLGLTTTITWPTLTTTLLSSSVGSIYTVTTTISVPKFTMTALSLQPITLGPTDTATYVLDPVQSVTPTSFIFTLGPNQATFPASAVPGESQSTRGIATSSSTGTTGAAILPGVTFHPTPFPITIQPQPTYSVTLPSLSKPVPAITISTGTPKSTCSGTGCGSRDCGIFGCSPGCGLFGCDGGCSIFGCGGGCGPLGCVGACALDVCGGLGCIVPGSCGGSFGEGDGDDDCDEPVTVSACTYIVSSYSTAPMTAYSTTTTTSCSTTTTCDGEDTKTTTTVGACSASISAAYASDAAAAGTVVSGITIPLALYPTVPSGATATPTVTAFGITLSSTTSNCEVCTYADSTEIECSLISGCTRSTVVTSTTATASTTTVTVVVEPTAKADCAFWDYGWFFNFEVYNIEGWATDGGSSLHKQEKGCGALTDWDWNAASSTTYASAYFNLPTVLKAGCVERAIVSAGGPELSCVFQGYDDYYVLDLAEDEGAKPDTLAQTSITLVSASKPLETSLPSYTYPTSMTTTSLYVPMTWNTIKSGTVTLTWTLSSTSTVLITTKTVVSSGSTVAIPSSTGASTSASSTSSRTSSGPTASKASSTTVKASSTSSKASSTTVKTSSTTFKASSATSKASSATSKASSISSKLSSTSIKTLSATSIKASSITSSKMSTTSSTKATGTYPGTCVSSVYVSAPSPVETVAGTTTKCCYWYTVASGDDCETIDTRFGITLGQFLTWNTYINANCTNLWLGYSYCVDSDLAVPAISSSVKRGASVLIGFRTVSPQQALIYENAGSTLVWSAPQNSAQIGPGTYISPVVADWFGPGDKWYCAILADSGAWNLVNKAWVPEYDGCKPLWFAPGVPYIPAYLTSVGGSGFSVANTVLLSQIAGYQKLQLTIPQQLQGSSGGLGIVTQCVASSDTAGVDALRAYGSVDWSSWLNVKGTVQTVSPASEE